MDEDFYNQQSKGDLFPGADDIIHGGLHISKGQLACLLMAFHFRHQLSKTAHSDLLSLLLVMVPNCLPMSKYFLNKYFFPDKAVMESHLYCSKCTDYIGVKTDVIICRYCNTKLDCKQLKKDGCMFMYSPITLQLQNLLETTDLWQIIQNNLSNKCSEQLSEIYTGSVYNSKNIADFIGERGCKNFSMTFNTDGVNVFNLNDRLFGQYFAQSIKQVLIKSLNFNVKFDMVW